MDDKEYWNEYYKTHSNPGDESTFANFVLSRLEKGKTLIELGCGNGRDSIYFSKNGMNIIAVDQVKDEIDYLNGKYKNENLIFVCDDFTNLIQSENDLIRNSNFDYVYSRFTFHSINEKKEDRTIQWIEDNLKKDGLFFLEARSLNDPMFRRGKALSDSENFTTHYRRYMDLEKFTDKLESGNFRIEYSIEDNNLAVYKDDNPYVIRIIARKL